MWNMTLRDMRRDHPETRSIEVGMPKRRGEVAERQLRQIVVAEGARRLLRIPNNSYLFLALPTNIILIRSNS